MAQQLTGRGNAAPALWKVALPAALFGAAFGLFRMPTWHVAVESAQVLAGLVTYPPDNPFYLYHVSTWTLLHRVAALCLAIFPSEIAVSYLYSAALGALTSIALALAAFAICNRTTVALFVPLFAFAVYGGSDVYGVAYPIYLAGTHHTYGVVGRDYALLALALLGLRRDRTAAVLLGLFPAVHITWAAFTWCVVGAVMLMSRSTARQIARHARMWFLAGFAVAVLSYGIHQIAFVPAAATNTETRDRLTQVFLQHWDGHRQPIDPLRHAGFALAIGAFVLAATLLFREKRDRAESRSAFAVLLSVAALLGLSGVLFTQVQHYFPTLLQLLMPARFINLLVLAHPAVFIAFAARFIDRRWGRIPFVVLLVYPFALAMFRVFLSSDRFGWDLPHVVLFCLLLIPLALGAISQWMFPKRTQAGADFSESKRRFFATTYAAVATVLVGVGIFGLIPSRHASSTPPVRSGIFESLSYGKGTIITPSATELVQLRTGRPILLNTGALDQIAYVPQSAPAIQRILDRVYGVDLLDPPEAVQNLRPGALPPGIEDETWRQRPREEWMAIGEEFGAVTVLAREDTVLDLPALYTSDGFTAYEIPAEQN